LLQIHRYLAAAAGEQAEQLGQVIRLAAIRRLMAERHRHEFAQRRPALPGGEQIVDLIYIEIENLAPGAA